MAFLFFLRFKLFIFLRCVFGPISWLLFWMFFFLMTPILFFYSRNIKSEVVKSTEEALRQAPLVAQITKTQRVIFGHTHREMHTFVDSTEVLNTGTWSPAFKDPECRVPFTKCCFAWIRSENPEKPREAMLYYWKDPGIEQVAVQK